MIVYGRGRGRRLGGSTPAQIDWLIDWLTHLGDCPAIVLVATRASLVTTGAFGHGAAIGNTRGYSEEQQFNECGILWKAGVTFDWTFVWKKCSECSEFLPSRPNGFLPWRFILFYGSGNAPFTLTLQTLRKDAWQWKRQTCLVLVGLVSPWEFS